MSLELCPVSFRDAAAFVQPSPSPPATTRKANGLTGRNVIGERKDQ